MRITFNYTNEKFIKFKKVNDLPDNYQLESGDSRSGGICAIVKRESSGGRISIVYGYATYKQVIGFMDGYTIALNNPSLLNHFTLSDFL